MKDPSLLQSFGKKYSAEQLGLLANKFELDDEGIKAIRVALDNLMVTCFAAGLQSELHRIEERMSKLRDEESNIKIMLENGDINGDD